jgi:adenosine deaminase
VVGITITVGYSLLSASCSNYYKLVDSAAALKIVTEDVIRDFALDGVRYLELRTTPRAMEGGGVSKAMYIEIVLGVMAALEGVVDITVRLLLSIDRRATVEEAADTVQLAMAYMHHGVVGVDLSGMGSQKGSANHLTQSHTQTHVDTYIHAFLSLSLSLALSLSLSL